MMKKRRSDFYAAFAALAAFALWTAAVCTVDIQPIGPRGASVGLASFNRAVHDFTGVHWTLYNITDWLGLVPVAYMLRFAAVGLSQWIRRRSILKVDRSILVLGGLYLSVAAAYLLFEKFTVNYRPVLINGFLEASYPSSTTLLVLTVMPSAAMQLRQRIKCRTVRHAATAAITAFSVFMAAGRAISGVHWMSDIIGGTLLSAALMMFYRTLTK